MITPEDALFIGLFSGFLIGYSLGFFVARYIYTMRSQTEMRRALDKVPAAKPGHGGRGGSTGRRTFDD